MRSFLPNKSWAVLAITLFISDFGVAQVPPPLPTAQLVPIINSLLLDDPSGDQVFSTTVGQSKTEDYSENFKTLYLASQRDLLKVLKDKDPSIVASNFFVGSVPKCKFQLPKKYFSVPRSGEYHVTSYVRGGPSPNFLSPEFTIYDEKGTSVLTQFVSNQVMGGNATFYLRNSYRKIDVVLLEAGRKYYLQQRYTYMYFGKPGQEGGEFTCPDKVEPPAPVDLGIQVIRRSDLVNKDVAENFGYSDIQKFLEDSKTGLSQQTNLINGTLQWDKTTTSKYFDPFTAHTGFDYLNNDSKLFQGENWVQRQSLDSSIYDASLTQRNIKSSCLSNTSCFFAQMPLLMQTAPICGAVAGAMTFAGLVSEIPPTGGSWISNNFSRIIGQPSWVSRDLLSPSGLAQSPEVLAMVDLMGYNGGIPSIYQTINGVSYTQYCQAWFEWRGKLVAPAEGFENDDICIYRDFYKLGILARKNNFSASKSFSADRFPVVTAQNLKERLQTGNKFGMVLGIYFTKAITEQGIGLTSIRFEIDQNFRNSQAAGYHALSLNGYSGDNFLFYNPWELEHYMKVRNVSVGGSVAWSANPINQIAVLPGATSAATYLHSFNWADNEFHPESYYWFVRNVYGIANQ